MEGGAEGGRQGMGWIEGAVVDCVDEVPGEGFEVVGDFFSGAKGSLLARMGHG